MASKTAIDNFLEQETLAVVGVSRNKKKFPYLVFNNLHTKGYHVLPVNPNTERIDGEVCYPCLQELPRDVGGIVLIVPPQETEKLVREAAALGIKNVWIQPGAESADAIKYCEEHGINVIHHHCVMMFAQPTGVHKFHRQLWKLLGKEPK